MLFLVVIFTSLITLMIVALIYTSRPAYKMRDIMFHKYYIMDDLWLKTGLSNSLSISYQNSIVDVRVGRTSLSGTNKNCFVYYAFINDIRCATAIKLCDTHNFYYTFYVDDKFDNEEVWSILEAANNWSKEQQKLEERATDSRKMSILEESK